MVEIECNIRLLMSTPSSFFELLRCGRLAIVAILLRDLHLSRHPIHHVSLPIVLRVNLVSTSGFCLVEMMDGEQVRVRSMGSKLVQKRHLEQGRLGFELEYGRIGGIWKESV